MDKTGIPMYLFYPLILIPLYKYKYYLSKWEQNF